MEMISPNKKDDLPSRKAKRHISEKSSATYVNAREIHFTWKIHKFSLWEIGDSELESSKFSASAEDGYSWQLSLHNKTLTADSKVFLSVALRFLPNSKTEATAKCRFYVIDANNKKQELSQSMKVRRFTQSNPETKHWQFIDRSRVLDTANNMLKNDTLTIGCEITIFENFITNAVDFNCDIWESAESFSMIDSKKYLSASPELRDVTIITSGYRIQADKLILSVESEVFAAMFMDDKKEKRENEVTIDDVHRDVLIEMLRFIYTRKTPKLDRMPAQLLEVAHKYKIKKLKDQCEKELSKSIKTEDAADLLILSDLNRALYLKSQVLNFICLNAEEVMGTARYQNMHDTHAHLIDEAFRALVKKTKCQCLRQLCDLPPRQAVLITDESSDESSDD